MSMQTEADVPLIITVPGIKSSDPPQIQSERRISPSWTFGQFKGRMEPITGIPPSSMRIEVRGKDVTTSMAEGDVLATWGLSRGETVTIHDTRPPGLRQSLLFDPSAPDAAPKYEMPVSAYESRSDSVLAWKRNNNLGRFDPSAPTLEDLAVQRHERDTSFVTSRNISTGQRCRVGGSDTRRGQVKFVGEVSEIEKDKGAVWVGVEFDEPVGKNNGTINGKKYFDVKGEKFGVFVRPENVEVGEQYGAVDDLLDEDMEEI